MPFRSRLKRGARKILEGVRIIFAPLPNPPGKKPSTDSGKVKDANRPKSNMSIRAYRAEDQGAVVQLWHESGLVAPHIDPRGDIARKMAFQPDLFWVGEEEGQIVASVMVGYHGHRGWINFLAVSPACQGSGFGREMMEEAEKRLRAMGCAKINLQVRATNLKVVDFYKRIGFVVEDVVSMGKRL
jgi:ribosomal protein S18 acetylase RimI-like enzyme